MSFDLPDFIDPKAIREHIRYTGCVFTPAEQAVLVSRSCERTVREKLEALGYLYGNNTDEGFGADKVGMFGYGDRECMTFRERLGRYISGIRASLALRDTSEGYVFIACECEEGFEYSDFDKRYFGSYEGSYKYIKELKAENSAELPECKYEYRITAMPVGAAWGYSHTYDNELRFVKADPVFPNGDELPMLDISEYYVFVPLPFRRGEIVKIRSRGRHRFGDDYAVFTFPDDETDERFIRFLKHSRQSGDHSDMSVSLTYFTPDSSHSCGGAFWYDYFDVLGLDSCDESDLDKVEYGTKYLAAALDADCKYDMWNLLLDYSHGDFRDKKVFFDAEEYLMERVGGK